MEFVEVKDKQQYLDENCPYSPVPNIKEKKMCLYCEQLITVGDYKVVRQHGHDFICCPKAPLCDGTAIHWTSEKEYYERIIDRKMDAGDVVRVDASHVLDIFTEKEWDLVEAAHADDDFGRDWYEDINCFDLGWWGETIGEGFEYPHGGNFSDDELNLIHHLVRRRLDSLEFKYTQAFHNKKLILADMQQGFFRGVKFDLTKQQISERLEANFDPWNHFTPSVKIFFVKACDRSRSIDPEVFETSDRSVWRVDHGKRRDSAGDPICTYEECVEVLKKTIELANKPKPSLV